MKNVKKFVAVLAVVGVISIAGAVYAFAATTSSNAACQTPEAKQQMLENKKVVLDQRVKEGSLTQVEADKIYNTIKEKQATCDGTGSAMIGRKNGVGFGNGQGMGMGKNQGGANCTGTGSGVGNGSGRGMMNR